MIRIRGFLSDEVHIKKVREQKYKVVLIRQIRLYVNLLEISQAHIPELCPGPPSRFLPFFSQTHDMKHIQYKFVLSSGFKDSYKNIQDGQKQNLFALIKLNFYITLPSGLCIVFGTKTVHFTTDQP